MAYFENQIYHPCLTNDARLFTYTVAVACKIKRKWKAKMLIAEPKCTAFPRLCIGGACS